MLNAKLLPQLEMGFKNLIIERLDLSLNTIFVPNVLTKIYYSRVLFSFKQNMLNAKLHHMLIMGFENLILERLDLKHDTNAGKDSFYLGLIYDDVSWMEPGLDNNHTVLEKEVFFIVAVFNKNCTEGVWRRTVTGLHCLIACTKVLDYILATKVRF